MGAGGCPVLNGTFDSCTATSSDPDSDLKIAVPKKITLTTRQDSMGTFSYEMAKTNTNAADPSLPDQVETDSVIADRKTRTETSLQDGEKVLTEMTGSCGNDTLNVALRMGLAGQDGKLNPSGALGVDFSLHLAAGKFIQEMKIRALDATGDVAEVITMVCQPE
jgi:hypothetical protein